MVFTSQVAALLAAAAIAAAGAVLGLGRSRRAGRVDPFHPLLFPSVYVAVACLATPLWLYLTEIDLGYVKLAVLAPQTPLLMALAVVGFTLGAAIPFARRVVVTERRISPRALEVAGISLILLPLGLSVRGYLNDTVLTRSLGQDTVTLSDSIGVLGEICGPASVILIIVARLHQKKSLFSISEGVLVAALVGLNGLNGNRSAALSVMISIMVFMTRRRGVGLRALLGFSAIITFVYVIVLYRVAAVNGPREVSFVNSLLQDLGSVTFTTGVTADLVTEGFYLDGGSILFGLIRQVPGPVINSILGPPDDTGAFQFRHLSGLTTDSNGYGYSLPAEGVLNFGPVGAFLLPFVAGVLVAWMYARFTPTGGRATHILYAAVACTLPYAFRSDTLGAVKGVLYPGIIFGAALAVAAAVRRHRARRSRLVRPVVSRAPGGSSPPRGAGSPLVAPDVDGRVIETARRYLNASNATATVRAQRPRHSRLNLP
jgi:hypothetical protein